MYTQFSLHLNNMSVNPVAWFGNGLTLSYPFLHG